MITLLRKLFIKNYKDVNKKEVRDAHGKLAAVIGIITNVLLFVAKLIIGLISGSISVLADSINNMSDSASSIMTLVGFKLSSKPADDKHPYGHERIEYIIGLIVSVFVLIVGCLFFYNSILKCINKTEISINIVSIVILSVSIVVKLLQALMYKKMGKIINSLALKATAVDSRNDCITTLTVLIGIIVFYIWGINLDGYFGVAVSIFIIISGIKLILETSSPLIGEAIDKTYVDNIVGDIKKNNMVLGVHDMRIHSYGPLNTFMSIHVEVPASENVLILHDEIDNIENEIASKYGIEITIHMDPIENTNTEVIKLKEVFEKSLSEIDLNLQLHDFRIVKRTTSINVIFDVVIPRKSTMTKESITERLLEKTKEYGNFRLVINYENGYI